MSRKSQETIGPSGDIRATTESNAFQLKRLTLAHSGPKLTAHSWHPSVSRLLASNALGDCAFIVTNLQGRRITSPDARYPSGTPIDPEIYDQQKRLSTLAWPLGAQNPSKVDRMIRRCECAA
jgi:hypothetical protein